jgi:hypothetical protein
MDKAQKNKFTYYKVSSSENFSTNYEDPLYAVSFILCYSLSLR